MFIIRLCCPECGGHTWISLEEDGCVCADCNAHVEPDEMTSECVEV